MTETHGLDYLGKPYLEALGMLLEKMRELRPAVRNPAPGPGNGRGRKSGAGSGPGPGRDAEQPGPGQTEFHAGTGIYRPVRYPGTAAV